jgi:hypothetical protein
MAARNSLFLGAYWKERGESLADGAARISSFLLAAGAADATLATWVLEGLGASGAFRRADISAPGIESLLRTKRQEFVSFRPALKIGFSLGLWNGLNASFHATIGATSRRVSNAILHFLPKEEPRDPRTWRELMSAAVQAFEPDSAIVARRDRVSRDRGGFPDAAGGWFTYRRGEPIVEHPFH